MGKKIKRYCTRCGKEIIGRMSHAKYCLECSYIVKKEMAKVIMINWRKKHPDYHSKYWRKKKR